MDFLNRFFRINEKGGSIGLELIAGLTTFATMTYVLAVQPSAIVGFGADSFTDITGLVITKEAIMLSTALISGLVTILMGLFAKLPFALSTGMGTNFLFGALIQTGEISFSGAMTITLISGILFITLTAFGVRDLIVDMIPKNIKTSIGVSIGFFIAYLGFKNSGIGSFVNGISMGDFGDVAVLLALLGLFLIFFLESKKVKGGILIGILVITIIGIFVTNSNGSTITNLTGVFSIPNLESIKNIMFQFNIKELFTWSAIPLIFVVFCGDFFSTLGTILGVAGKVNMLDENGNLPEISKPFMVDAIGTAVGATFGCTTVTTYVESASGVGAGGRTGLTAVVVGILFLISMFFEPLFTSIPNAATGPALIFIGYLMINGIKNLNFEDFTEFFGPFVMIMFAAFAGGITAGIAMGIISHVFIKVTSGKFREIHIGMYILTIPLILYFVADALM